MERSQTSVTSRPKNNLEHARKNRRNHFVTLEKRTALALRDCAPPRNSNRSRRALKSNTRSLNGHVTVYYWRAGYLLDCSQQLSFAWLRSQFICDFVYRVFDR
jgi:hypothetical protein